MIPVTSDRAALIQQSIPDSIGVDNSSLVVDQNDSDGQEVKRSRKHAALQRAGIQQIGDADARRMCGAISRNLSRAISETGPSAGMDRLPNRWTLLASTVKAAS